MPHRSGKRPTALRPDHGWSSTPSADLIGLAPAGLYWLVRTGTDTGPHLALRQVTVADDALAAVRGLQIGMLVEKVRDLGLDGPGEQGTGPVAQDCMFEPKARVFHSVFVVSIVRSVGLVHREGDQPLSRCRSRVDRRRI